MTRRLRAPRGPKFLSGSQGTSTSATMRNLSTLTTSSRETRRMRGCTSGLEERSVVTTTAMESTVKTRRPTCGMTSGDTARAPRRKVTRNAASEVIPRSTPRRTTST
jgi:hypothetical protein